MLLRHEQDTLVLDVYPVPGPHLAMLSASSPAVYGSAHIVSPDAAGPLLILLCVISRLRPLYP